MLLLEFPSDDPRNRVGWNVTSVVVRPHALLVALPPGNQPRIIAEDAGILGWRLKDEVRAPSRFYPYFTVKAKGA